MYYVLEEILIAYQHLGQLVVSISVFLSDISVAACKDSGHLLSKVELDDKKCLSIWNIFLGYRHVHFHMFLHDHKLY